ncbi:hypothetical protein HNP84_008900 [Thermocatellispora tengchongensis]|uniref:Lipoprotein n=1 Tax=Thermocatellispora tengchongensis TaxID=1073253 RepID=A0A840PPY0_9ACTN|nr:hypothetical protein [Thermocatellispora tengchongensis]MBB5139137.1 hypothetical protein [Thermocatellispora tengchongensis]
MRARGAGLLLPALLLAALAACASPAAAPEPPDDASIVYCTASDRVNALVDAAVALGVAARAAGAPDRLVAGGKTLTVAEWRAARPGDFARACAGLVGARSPAPGGGGPGALGTLLTTLITTLLPVLLGAALTIAGGELRVRADQRAQDGMLLRKAMTDFATAFTQYVEESASDSPPARSPVPPYRAELNACLVRMQVRHPRRPEPRRLIEELAALEELPRARWSAGDKSALRDGLLARLRALQVEVEKVAASPRPWARPWRRGGER